MKPNFIARVDLDYIPPELRENCGEFEAAAEGNLPRLIELANLRGTFHCHTTASDGHNTLEEMADGGAGARSAISRHRRSQPQLDPGARARSRPSARCRWRQSRS